MLALLLALALPLHDEQVSDSQISVSGNELLWKLHVGVLDLGKVLKFPVGPTEMTEIDLKAMREPIARLLGSFITAEINGERIEPEAGLLEPVYERYMKVGDLYIGSVTQEFRFRSKSEVKSIRLGLSVFGDLTSRHRALVTVGWTDVSRPFALLGPAELYLTHATMDPGSIAAHLQYFVWGMQHILIGYDHVAFLLALLIAASRLMELVKIVTAFTVAHSITLIFAAMDWIRLPTALTEALIAATIVYVALENYFLKEGRWRWAQTFGFGLIHGLGFATVLRDRLNSEAVVVPILTFNLGVEAGQLAILAVLYPLALLAVRAPTAEAIALRRRRLVVIGSAPILLLGAGWLIDRAFGLGFMPL